MRSARTCESFPLSLSKPLSMIMSAAAVCYLCQLSLIVPGQPHHLVYTSLLLERRILLRNTIMSYIGPRTLLGTIQRLLRFVGTGSRLCGEGPSIILFSWYISRSYTGILRKYAIKWLRCYQGIIKKRAHRHALAFRWSRPPYQTQNLPLTYQRQIHASFLATCLLQDVPWIHQSSSLVSFMGNTFKDSGQSPMFRKRLG